MMLLSSRIRYSVLWALSYGIAASSPPSKSLSAAIVVVVHMLCISSSLFGVYCRIQPNTVFIALPLLVVLFGG